MRLKVVTKALVRCYNQIRLMYFGVRSLWYLGNRFICPCCDGHFRKFLPFGIKPQPKRINAACPRCGSLERHRLLWMYLKDKTNFFTGKLKVLEIGPIEFLQRKYRGLKNIYYVSGDISSSIAMVEMDVTHIPMLDSQFDCIICSSVLQYVRNDQKAIRELFRVLKPGGWVIIQVPVDPGRKESLEDPNVLPQERARVFGHKDHVRIYGRDIADRLKGAGFNVTLDNYFSELKEDVIKKYCLKDEPMYLCTKE